MRFLQSQIDETDLGIFSRSMHLDILYTSEKNLVLDWNLKVGMSKARTFKKDVMVISLKYAKYLPTCIATEYYKTNESFCILRFGSTDSIFSWLSIKTNHSCPNWLFYVCLYR